MYLSFLQSKVKVKRKIRKRVFNQFNVNAPFSLYFGWGLKSGQEKPKNMDASFKHINPFFIIT